MATSRYTPSVSRSCGVCHDRDATTRQTTAVQTWVRGATSYHTEEVAKEAAVVLEVTLVEQQNRQRGRPHTPHLGRERAGAFTNERLV